MMTMDKLLKMIEEQGVEKIRFEAPFKTSGVMTPLGLMVGSNDPEEMMLCRINEDRYKVSDHYKITLEPCKATPEAKSEDWYNEDYYLLDLCSLIDCGVVKVLS